MTDLPAARELAEIVTRGIGRGKIVEIEGLGVFYPDTASGFRFEPWTLPQVFIAHAREDAAEAERLAVDLEHAGFDPWTDARRLVPGQNWPRAIENAIDRSDFFLACFSSNSVNKKGGFQAEIRYALDCARRVPLDTIFVVPVRLNGCRIPRSIQRELQYVDLFPDWEAGFRRIATMMDADLARRGRSRNPPAVPRE